MRVTIIEIDLPYCSRTYGVAPCTASVGVTGSIKCFNCLRTCQDKPHYAATSKTLRFCLPSERVEFQENGQPIVVIPSLDAVTITPAIVNPGVDIGMRETVKVTFKDHPHSDAGLDKYLSERPYDAFSQGTFWAKIEARWPSLEGYGFRLRRGEYGTDVSTWDTYHYVIDSGSMSGESYQIAAKDPLILTDKKKSQAPRLSAGTLSADITSASSSITMLPSGIGDAEYPASGIVSIGGKEAVSFTRSGDVMTIIRGQLGTTADDHDEGDLVQLVLSYAAQNVSAIIYDLLTNYVDGFDPDWINLSQWEDDVDGYIGRLYTADIAQPEAVQTLLNELIEQVGLVLSWDAINRRVNLQPLRAVTAGVKTYGPDNMVESSFKSTSQPDKRVSEVWTYYGIRNPLEDLDKTSNYQAAVATLDPNSDIDYPQPAIKQILSRWILVTNRAAAQQLNAMILARYRDAPRKFEFAIRDTTPPTLGSGAQVTHWRLQQATGEQAIVPMQITSVNIAAPDVIMCSAQEAVFVEQPDEGGGTGGGGGGGRYIYIDTATFNVNLRSLHDTLYAVPVGGESVTFVVNAAIGGARAVDIGSWPVGVTIEVRINAGVRGQGGAGGASDVLVPTVGGTAIYTRYPINLKNNNVIAAGGGGGGCIVYSPAPGITRTIGGGGGAGVSPGTNGPCLGTSTPATRDAGGVCTDGMTSGPGGAPGVAGDASYFQSGAAPGKAIDGVSYVTFLTAGTIIGDQVN
jgi:hypothetical protein